MVDFLDSTSWSDIVDMLNATNYNAIYQEFPFFGKLFDTALESFTFAL